MIAEALKKALLQAAIQGKLTEQLPEDGNARDLLKDIQKEKDRLVKEGKIKREKPLPEITEDEIPFDIPENWVWTRLRDISSVLGDGLHGTPKYHTNGEFYFINGNNLIDGKIEFKNDTKRVNFDEYRKYQKPLGEASILVSINGTLGNVAFYNNEKIILGKSACYFNVLGQISKKYVKVILNSHYFIDYAMNIATGSTIKNVSLAAMRLLLIPLPPLSEQERIVKIVGELLPEIEALKSEENKLDNLEKAFPSKIRASILQAAVQGKLTEQLPEDGDARALLKEIQKEKARLVKEGKIKQEKPLPEITEGEIPFDIPECWAWVRLGEFSKIINGFTPLRSNLDFWDSPDIPWFTVKDIRDQGHFIDHTQEYISKAAINGSERIVQANSVLLCCTASIGEYAYTNIDLTTNQQFNGITVNPLYERFITPMYIYYYVQTIPERLLTEAGKTTFPFLSTKKLANFAVPVAPLTEQKRIVKKLEELLPLCTSLETTTF